MEDEKYEFIDSIKENNGVFRVTIPSKLVNFLNLEQGDIVRILVTKANKEVETNEDGS